MEQFVLGFLVGVVTNIFSWWILAHYVVPSIHFSPSISKRPRVSTERDAAPFGYRIKLENRGRRSVIDLELIVRLRINWPPDYLPSTWTIFNVPLSESGGDTYRIPRILPVSKGKHVRTTVRLHINDIDEFRDKPFYPEPIRFKAKERALLLEDILSLGPQPTLQVLAFGYDEFSGARKLFVSKLYTMNDIKEGLFRTDGLEVVETPSPREADASQAPDETH